MLNQPKLWATGLLVATFAAGTVVGSAVSAAWGDKRSTGARSGKGMASPSYAAHLESLLELSAAQRDSIEDVLTRHQPAIHALWEEVGPRFDSIRGAIRLEIGEALTDEQRRRYLAHVAERDSARRHYGKGGSGGS